MPSPREIDSLTTIRGLAALWVVVFHLWSTVPALVPQLARVAPFGEAGYLAVPFFFVLSGYVLGLRYLASFATLRARDVTRFLLLRLGRIYPVHFVMLVACIALVARHGWPTDEPHSKTRLLECLLLVQAWGPTLPMTWNFPAWSISSEWFAYLAFPILAAAVTRASRAALVALVGLCVMLGVLAEVVHAPPFEGLVKVVPTFLGGVAIARLVPPGSRATPAVRAGAIASTVLVVVLPLAFSPAVSAGALVALAFAAVALFGGAGNANANRASVWSWRPLVRLGDVSYSLYMVHATAITLFFRVRAPGAYVGRGALVGAAYLAAFLAFVVASAFALHYAVEKPCREASRRWTARPSPSCSTATPGPSGW